MALSWRVGRIAAPLLLVLLCGPRASQQTRSLTAMGPLDVLFNTTDEHCDCAVCRRSRLGRSYCAVCHSGRRPSEDVPCRCDLPHCVECHDGDCMKCNVGYSIRSNAGGECRRNFFYRRSYTPTPSDYKETKIDYSDTYSIGLLPLLLASTIVVIVLRRLRFNRRSETVEVSTDAVLNDPTPALTTALPDGSVSTENATVEKSPLLSQGEPATKSNSVLVLGPSGSIGVGVAENADVTAAPQGP